MVDTDSLDSGYSLDASLRYDSPSTWSFQRLIALRWSLEGLNEATGRLAARK